LFAFVDSGPAPTPPSVEADDFVRMVAQVLTSRGCRRTLSDAFSQSPISMYQNSGGSSRFFLLFPEEVGEEHEEERKSILSVSVFYGLFCFKELEARRWQLLASDGE